MDCRSVLLFCLAVFLAILVTNTEGRTKKVIIHVPYKVKKFKHTHTVYKTVHHHHTHHDHLDHTDHLDHDDHLDHLDQFEHLDQFDHLNNVLSPIEEHEHFHHMHLVEDKPIRSQGHKAHGAAVPEFLPDAPINLPLELNKLSRDVPGIPKRLNIPLYRRDDTNFGYYATSKRPDRHIFDPTLSSSIQ